MLYLEDYLEMIEQLPMDLRDRFTEMREMDLQVQNATDQLEQKVIEFFVNAKKNKPEWREEQMEVIKKDYYKALEDADEKVQLANQIYDLVDRHLRKLDQELAKFKMELEADNAGITEILERRSLEMDSPSQPVNNHHVHSHSSTEKRKYSAPVHHTTEHVPEKKFKSEALLSTLTSDASKENTPGCRTNSTSSSSTNNVYSVNSSQPLASYNLSSLPAGPGAGAGAITMAAAPSPSRLPVFPEAASSLLTISPLHRPPLPLCRHALHRRHWLRSFPSRPQRCLRPRPTARWTGPTTPTSPDTASVTRCLMEKWWAVITQIAPSSGSTTAVWV
ncbi:inhibitor of growth protein 3 isoform X2 [Cebidichthys violaceus]|uniref:inhibitor of growth protein 3 isoform X2 n=1 Tax=Cebidichthys violaceus TaxID=271503 RepID=UPI0035CC71F8